MPRPKVAYPSIAWITAILLMTATFLCGNGAVSLVKSSGYRSLPVWFGSFSSIAISLFLSVLSRNSTLIVNKTCGKDVKLWTHADLYIPSWYWTQDMNKQQLSHEQPLYNQPVCLWLTFLHVACLQLNCVHSGPNVDCSCVDVLLNKFDEVLLLDVILIEHISSFVMILVKSSSSYSTGWWRIWEHSSYEQCSLPALPRLPVIGHDAFVNFWWALAFFVMLTSLPVTLMMDM